VTVTAATYAPAREVLERMARLALARDEAGRSSAPISLDDLTTLMAAAHDCLLFAGRIERAEAYLAECVEKLANVDVPVLQAMLRDPVPEVKPDNPVRHAATRFLTLALTSQLALLRDLGLEVPPFTDARTAHDVTIPALLSQVREQGLFTEFVAAVEKRLGNG
jgi:hypothetical protein